jgi:tetratricopeptide (TPR) repeat protein
MKQSPPKPNRENLCVTWRKRQLTLVAVSFFPLLSFGADIAQLIGKADSLDKQGRNQEALAVCLDAEKLSPGDAEVLRRVAKHYAEMVLDAREQPQKRGLAEKAVEYARRAVAASPKSALAHLSLAICYGRAATVADARTKIAYSKLIKEHADNALALDPNNDLTYYVLGSWSHEMANLNGFLRAAARVVYGAIPTATNKDALRFLEKAVALNPRRVANHAALGRSYAALGERERARQSFNRALGLPNGDKGDELLKQQAREDLAKL